MPNITAAGTYDETTTGFGGLRATNGKRIFHFSGSSLGTACTVKYIDDTGTAAAFANGSITTLPYEFELDDNIDCQIVVTGSPNFNVTITS